MELRHATVEVVVPGSPAALERLEAGLQGCARVASGAVERLGGLETGDWVGEAADGFRGAVGEVPAKLGAAAGAFGEAASAVANYREVLGAARHDAVRAIELWRQGDLQTGRWEADWTRYRLAQTRAEAAEDPASVTIPSRPSSTDPGSWERAEAQRLAERARASVDDAAHRAARTLQAAGQVAPDEPGFWSKAWHHATQFGAGIWDSTAGMVEFAWDISPVRMLIDPDGWAEDVTALGQGIVYGITHPVEFAKAATNWDMWLDNPARALGQLVPDLAIALATAGGGTAATATRRGADTADTLTDLARTTNRIDDLGDGAFTGDRLSDLTDIRRLVDDVATDPVDIDLIRPEPSWRVDRDPLWRADNRPPQEVFDSGFRPWNQDHLDLADYVENNTRSAFVGTSRRQDLYADWGSRYRYQIDAPGGIDVNDTLGPHRFATEAEVAFPGGIRSERIRGAQEVLEDGSLGPLIPNPRYSP